MYTSEVNCQILIALLKTHGVRTVIVNPGTANMSFVGSIQSDPWFRVYSGVDERHSAYMAVGMAAEMRVPVALSCTGATASRNYLPALTEAYYRKLPILAITSTQEFTQVGQLNNQVLDRSQPPKDTVVLSVSCPLVKDAQTRRYCEREVNRAILELMRHGGGPVHINLETRYPLKFDVKKLPEVAKITRHFTDGEWPLLPDTQRIVLWIGEHGPFGESEKNAIEQFLRSHQAVALVNKQSSYYEYGAVSSELLAANGINRDELGVKLKPNLIIHIGNVTAGHFTNGYLENLAPVWRVNPDGEIRDCLLRVEKVFQMSELAFFSHYFADSVENKYFEEWCAADASLRCQIPELPFSNYWIAQSLNGRLPKGANLHLGILSSVRAWSFAPNTPGITSYCNSGGFGIDGNLSTLIGASLVAPQRLHFGVFGDLSFFYDMNALGNRHIGNNLRILIINNGEGVEFSLFCNPGAFFGDKTSDFIGAGGHFGRKSRTIIKHYSTDLGFKYLSASTKDEFDSVIGEFLALNADTSILLECFVEKLDDTAAFKALLSLRKFDKTLKSRISSCLPKSVKDVIKKVI